MIIREATSSDIPGILVLQEKFLVVNIDPEHKANGFVTTRFTPAQIEELMAFSGAFVATVEDNIVAYVFSGSWKFYSQWPIFEHMISLFPTLHFHHHNITTENTFQYGPICIDLAYRGTDLLYQLFEASRISLNKKYPTGVTFINKVNKRSYEAHTIKLGLIVIGEFNFNNNEYWCLAFDTNYSVLS